MNFVAIDVETANADYGSICQIGLARFEDGKITEEWCTLVDPEDYFDDVNIAIHGIEARMVKGKPKLPQIATRLRSTLQDTVSVCHTHFDRVALSRAYDKYELSPISTSWLDSARVVRRTWKDLARKGYGLANVCGRIGYEFKHHDALEDAKAAGHILLAAFHESQQGLEHWQRRVNQPIDPEAALAYRKLSRDGNPEGDLYGEVLVFTGALNLTRVEAANLAASIGCQVAPIVNKKTTILVVGDQDVIKLAGHEKSAKHRRAEQLVAEGHHIRIVNESTFKSLVQTSTNETGRCPAN